MDVHKPITKHITEGYTMIRLIKINQWQIHTYVGNMQHAT